MFSAVNQHACHQSVEESDSHDGQSKVDNETEYDVENDVRVAPFYRVTVAHDIRARCDSGRHQLNGGKRGRHCPDTDGDKHRTEERGRDADGGAVDSAHRVDDDHVSFGTQCRQGEDGHAERQRHGEFAQLADGFAELPGRKRVDRRHEWDGEQYQ